MGSIKNLFSIITVLLPLNTCYRFNKDLHLKIHTQESLELEDLINETNKPHILIDKSERRLYFISNSDGESFYFSFVFGSDNGKKVKAGDSKTPEGTYYVCDTYQSNKNYYFIALSYPNREDAKRGLIDGLISSEDYENIIDANNKKVCPPWDTNLGGAIGIHGKSKFYAFGLFNIPFSPLFYFYTSNGCIVVQNPNVDRLLKYVKQGMNVEIRE